MGEIVNFREATRRIGRVRPPASAETTGTILLFTGVRYERYSEAAWASMTPKSPAPGTGRRRKRA